MILNYGEWVTCFVQFFSLLISNNLMTDFKITLTDISCTVENCYYLTGLIIRPGFFSKRFKLCIYRILLLLINLIKINVFKLNVVNSM